MIDRKSAAGAQPGAPGSHFEPGAFDFSVLLDFFLYAHDHVSAAHRVQQSFTFVFLVAS
jgi:hypothetical protein